MVAVADEPATEARMPYPKALVKVQRPELISGLLLSLLTHDLLGGMAVSKDTSAGQAAIYGDGEGQ